jgi:hypothetical protein
MIRVYDLLFQFKQNHISPNISHQFIKKYIDIGGSNDKIYEK